MRDPMPIPVSWIRWISGVLALISLAGLLGIIGHDAWAADPPNDPRKAPKISPASKNPFIDPQAAGTFDDLEDVEFFEDVEPKPSQPAAKPKRPSLARKPKPPRRPPRKPPVQVSKPRSAGGSALDNDVPDPVRNETGIEVGGDANGGVIATEKEIGALSVDTESGIGSNEVVTDFNYPDVDIVDLAKTMGKLTGKNFILDNDVKGRVSIVSNSSITVSDAWRAFLTALDINKYTVVPSGKYIRISRKRDARDKNLKTYTGNFSPTTDAMITRVFQLKYISADEFHRVLRSISPANSRIFPYEQTNTLIVVDTGSNIARVEKILEVVDVEGFDAGIEVIPVKYASAESLAKLIDTLLPGTKTKSKSKRFGKGSFTSRRTKGGGVINNIIADERSNTMIVHANEKGVEQVRLLIAKLDKKQPSRTGGGKIRVVYLQYADAEKVAQTLNSLGTQKTSTNNKKKGVGKNPNQASLFEGSIRVAADKETNSLVITAGPSDFITIQRVINKLDIPRDEVYVEAVIMEMSLGSDRSFSVNAMVPPGIGFNTSTDLADFLINPAASKGMILGFEAGQKREILVSGQKIEVSSVLGLIKALQTKANANVLATPQILTLDNQEAIFESAEKIPVPSQTNVQGVGTTASITKESVALSLKIKPQINKVSNFVKMDIAAKMADIAERELPAQVRDLAFATIERSAETSVVVADGDTVVLGGMIRDKKSETVSKIPLLGDIPLLGWLFKSTRRVIQKSNLIIFITPHIIRQYEKVRAILDRKLQERDKFIEKASGGEDPHRDYRDDIIRKLPPIEDLVGDSGTPLSEDEDSGSGLNSDE